MATTCESCEPFNSVVCLCASCPASAPSDATLVRFALRIAFTISIPRPRDWLGYGNSVTDLAPSIERYWSAQRDHSWHYQSPARLSRLGMEAGGWGFNAADAADGPWGNLCVAKIASSLPSEVARPGSAGAR